MMSEFLHLNSLCGLKHELFNPEQKSCELSINLSLDGQIWYLMQFLPFSVAGGVPASPVPQDGCSILHCEGQGQAGKTGAQKNLHFSRLYTDKSVSEKWHYKFCMLKIWAVIGVMSILGCWCIWECIVNTLAMMFEFLQLNKPCGSMSFLTLSQRCKYFPSVMVVSVGIINWTFFYFSEDKGALAKLVEAIKTNYNDRYEEVSVKILRLGLHETR